MQPIDEFIVYMATNTTNGKRYVGATRKGLDGRRRSHLRDARRSGRTRDCPRFYDAIRKYGNDAFEWTVLATLVTSEEMYKEEERLIALLTPEYNIASGGLIFTSKEKQAKFAADQASKSSKPVMCLNDGSIYPSAVAAEKAFGLGHKIVSQQCKRGGVTRAGLSFVYLSGSMSEHERNQLLSERLSKKDEAEQSRLDKISSKISRPVTDLSTGTIYSSARAADKALNLVFGTVDSCCRRGKASRRGECFAFGELSEQDRCRLLEEVTAKRQEVDDGWKEKLSKKHSRVVICENTNRLFDNPKAAAAELGLSADTVYTHCRSGKPTRSGLLFSYLDEWCPNPL